MRKTILPLALSAALLVMFGFTAVVKAGSKNPEVTKADSDSATTITAASANEAREASAATAATALYQQLNLESLGLSYDAMLYAYKGHQQLLKQGKLQNADVLTICDFSQSSAKKRMYIIDVANGKVLYNTYVAHGKNSGLDYATRFSNKMESLQSSLGFYVTKATYSGKHGLSLKLDGQDRGWNDKAEQRAVVVHGAEYIGSSRREAAYMGRSFGCPAVPQQQAATVINFIKNGTCLFIYHPTNAYLHGSNILNG